MLGVIMKLMTELAASLPGGITPEEAVKLGVATMALVERLAAQLPEDDGRRPVVDAGVTLARTLISAAPGGLSDDERKAAAADALKLVSALLVYFADVLSSEEIAATVGAVPLKVAEAMEDALKQAREAIVDLHDNNIKLAERVETLLRESEARGDEPADDAPEDDEPATRKPRRRGMPTGLRNAMEAARARKRAERAAAAAAAAESEGE